LSTPRISGPAHEIWMNNTGLNSPRRDFSNDTSTIFLALVLVVPELSAVTKTDRAVVSHHLVLKHKNGPHSDNTSEEIQLRNKFWSIMV